MAIHLRAHGFAANPLRIHLRGSPLAPRLRAAPVLPFPLGAGPSRTLFRRRRLLRRPWCPRTRPSSWAGMAKGTARRPRRTGALTSARVRPLVVARRWGSLPCQDTLEPCSNGIAQQNSVVRMEQRLFLPKLNNGTFSFFSSSRQTLWNRSTNIVQEQGLSNLLANMQCHLHNILDYGEQGMPCHLRKNIGLCRAKLCSLST